MNKVKGFSLVELMVVVAIIGIIAAYAFSGAGDSGNKARRAVAKSVLMNVQSAQEQYFINNKGYTADLTALNFAANPMYIDAKGNSVAAADSFFQISATVTGLDYEIKATAQNAQTSDSSCLNLILKSNGSKTPAGCW